MIDLSQSPVQAAVVGTSITLVGGIILAVIGWFVTNRIGRLSRESSEMIAELSRMMTEQQIEIARGQVEINRQTQAMSLLKDRTALKEELFAAIKAREDEITFVSNPYSDKKPEALYALWKVEAKAKVLFGDDVQNLIVKIHEHLKRRNDILMKIRHPKQNGDISMNDEATAASSTIIELKDQLGLAMNRYSSMGHIRMLD